MCYLRRLFAIILLLGLVACSTTPAPVIDRLPQSNKPATPTSKPSSAKPTSKVSKPTGDWRPDTYTIKKGDTLFSIGLEHGYDYKEIAQVNEISAPYTIKIGQVLKFSPLKDKTASESKPAPQEKANGVLTYPIKTDAPSETATPVVATITEPKLIREPYSDEAFNKPLSSAKPASDKTSGLSKPANKPISDKPSAEKPNTETKTPEAKPETKPEVKPSIEPTDGLDWVWPTKGKIIANFNEAGNKGIDIAGNMGQSIQASAAGKVIYSGSDLRGYGKLVIIKHNANYLSVYANNSAILVKEGQQINQGQRIAEMGNTDSNTIKLHFEIRLQGKSIDPNKLLANH
ncbi:MAG: peptidoglycan DD-metalloendopeptidase family protein [Methylotenera sp.]|nr:peptidoglycan DD-metalloendopeptidase family protein [Methylotenera sp.]